MKKGIIFDMDGTLWDSAANVAESWNLAIKQDGSVDKKLTEQDIQGVMGKTMDVIADILRRFQDENIPILWRPFHESYGTWFWWGAKGAKVARDLYRLMFDYYTGEKNLHNLLWVWNCDIEEAYPGDEYVDVVSMDVYLPEYQATDYANAYEKLETATSRDKVAALAEVGYLPDVELLQKSRIPWAYYMTWSKEFCIGEKYNRVENLKKMYDSEYAVTL